MKRYNPVDLADELHRLLDEERHQREMLFLTV